MARVFMLAGKTVRNFIQGNKGHHSRTHHRMITTSTIKGTDATNQRPLENAPYIPSYRSGVAVKGRSLDDKTPGNLKGAGSMMFSIDKSMAAFVVVVFVFFLYASKK